MTADSALVVTMRTKNFLRFIAIIALLALSACD
jgi:hypothetical protein